MQVDYFICTFRAYIGRSDRDDVVETRDIRRGTIVERSWNDHGTCSVDSTTKIYRDRFQHTYNFEECSSANNSYVKIPCSV